MIYGFFPVNMKREKTSSYFIHRSPPEVVFEKLCQAGMRAQILVVSDGRYIIKYKATSQRIEINS